MKTLRMGGIETWLVHLLRHRDRFDVRHEILIMVDENGPYEPELRQMDVPIHKIAMDRGWLNWTRKLERFILLNGPFQVIHSHAAVQATALVMAVAAKAGIPVRIAHSHEARHLGADYTVRRRFTRAVAVSMVRIFSTRRIGISHAAIAEVSGRGWQRDPRSSILLYGFDYTANDGATPRAEALRRELMIPEDAKVVGHVGRFAPVKNHGLVMKTFAALRRRRSNVYLVLVGTGDLMGSVKSLARELEIDDFVRFAGSTNDVPAYMSMFDSFLFPSYSEGLGIVVLEAQAAGTPTLMTDSLPREVIVVPDAVEMVPIAASPEQWAARLDQLLDRSEPEPGKWRRAVESSCFGVLRCASELNRIYIEELSRAV